MKRFPLLEIREKVAKLSPAQSNSNLSWLGWDSFNFNFCPPTPRESTEFTSAQLNPTPTQLVGLIGSRISLKPAWAELGTAQSQLVEELSYLSFQLSWSWSWGNISKVITLLILINQVWWVVSSRKITLFSMVWNLIRWRLVSIVV